MIEKKDLLQSKIQFEGMLTNSELSVIFYKATLEQIEKEIAKFPIEEAKDPMPEEVKDMAKEMTK